MAEKQGVYHIMKTEFDIEAILKKGRLSNELDYERALVAERKLRLLAKEDEQFTTLRQQLRELLETYELGEWSDPNSVDDRQLIQSEKAEFIADQERQFLETRKRTIRNRLKQLELTQENLGSILGHKSKTHMSELMNGIKPFTLKDLIIMHRLLKIEMSVLVPVFLSDADQKRVKFAVEQLDKPKVKLAAKDFLF
jgi:antitoxin component HigA of HigAB toxin-antitoxin module